MTTQDTRIVREIPLSKLIPSSANVRRTGRDNSISELAASIAAHGLLQNLTVKPQIGADGEPTGKYEVIAGGRRLAALKLLAKSKRLPKGFAVPCLLNDAVAAEELSLAENITQSPMHPADQYEAFAKLQTEQGMGAEDIAARFGVTPTVVRQRMKLGAVSPKLMQLYRDGEVNLEQLMAFAITDDHERQERVWAELSWNKSREAIRKALMEGQVAANDRRARFVGAEVYEAAGGVIVRDLFDDEYGGFFADAELLDRLVRGKLAQAADGVRAEGWRWVEVLPEFDYQAAAGMRRVYPDPKSLSDDEQAQLDALEAEHRNLSEGEDGGDGADIDARLAELDAAIEGITGAEVFAAEDIERGGAFVSLAHDGSVRIERGFIRPQDEPARASAMNGSSGEESVSHEESPQADAAVLSDRLVAELTAYRTAGLKDALAQNPDIALLAVVYTLALRVFYPHSGTLSCLGIDTRSAYLTGHAPGIEDCAAEQRSGERHARWAKQLPHDAEDLWQALCEFDADSRLALLAHCAGATVNCVRVTERGTSQSEKHAVALAQAVGLDMTTTWTPTAEAYFNKVTKAQIIDAVREGAGDEAADQIADMKKGPMAQAAQQALASSGWLPSVLRHAAA